MRRTCLERKSGRCGSCDLLRRGDLPGRRRLRLLFQYPRASWRCSDDSTRSVQENLPRISQRGWGSQGDRAAFGSERSRARRGVGDRREGRLLLRLWCRRCRPGRASWSVGDVFCGCDGSRGVGSRRGTRPGVSESPDRCAVRFEDRWRRDDDDGLAGRRFESGLGDVGERR